MRSYTIWKSLPLVPACLLAPALGFAQAGSCPSPQVTITAPGAVAGDYIAGAAAFGPALDATGVSGSVILVDDGTDTGTDGCEAILNDVAGAIALIDRGNCPFTQKVLNAQLAGAIGAIVANNDGDDVITMGGSDDNITIVSAFVGQTDGGTFRSEAGVEGILLLGDTFENPQSRCERPIPMGVSGSTISEPGLYSGTLGMKVQALWNPERKFILSNNHVMAVENPTLCPNSATLPTPGSQPAGGDLGFNPGLDPDFVIGATTRFIPMDPINDNYVDAALVSTNDEVSSNEIINIGVPTADVILPEIGMPVIKSGRTTGTTESTIVAIGVTSNVSYGADCDVYRFVDQIQIDNPPDAFGGPGDSGSAILERDSKIPVGLLFAGSDTSIIANPMVFVWRATKTFPDGNGNAPRNEKELMARLDALKYSPEVQSLMDIKAQVQDSILATPGVVAIGVGRNAANDGYAFIVSVEAMTPALRRAIPHRVQGVPVITRVTGAMRALPLRAGPAVM
jgi:hypothetical protein